MLHDFLTREREAILGIVSAQAGTLEKGRGSSSTMDKGWGMFYDELTELMRQDEPFSFHNEIGHHTEGAIEHGQEYFQMGYSLSEVVHSYGIICQAITSHASELQFPITSREFQQLNLSLDTAIAEAVTQHDKVSREKSTSVEAERLGFLAHELRKCIQNITVTLEIILSGSVGAQSSTSSVLEKNINRMTKLIDGALTEVRLRSEPTVLLRRTRLSQLIHEVGVTAGFEARAKRVTLQIKTTQDHEVDVDPQMFISALANLVHNAIKFSHSGGVIQVRVLEKAGRIHVEVEDECGGLKDDVMDTLFQQEVRHTEDDSDLGRRLTITRQIVEQIGGKLSVENLPGKGCIFTIDLPKATSM